MAGDRLFPKTQALGPGAQALGGFYSPCIFIGGCDTLTGVSEQLSLVWYLNVRGRRKPIQLWLPSGSSGEGSEALQSRCSESINPLPAVSSLGARAIPDVRVRLSMAPSSVEHRRRVACCQLHYTFTLLTSFLNSLSTQGKGRSFQGHMKVCTDVLGYVRATGVLSRSSRF